MNAKPVVPREQANRDVNEAILYYLRENAEQAALGFIDSLERAYAHISRHPASGSPRYAHELNLPGLRSWPLARYPHMVFNVERSDQIDIWRVLHGQRDIPAWMPIEIYSDERIKEFEANSRIDPKLTAAARRLVRARRK